MIEVRDILKKYLKDNGYDGLVNTAIDCSCELNKLGWCVDIPSSCRAGHLKKGSIRNGRRKEKRGEPK